MKGKNYIVVSCKDIYWGINDNAPKLYRFKSNKSLALINPLYYFYENGWKFEVNYPIFHSINNEYVIPSNVLVFKKYEEETKIEDFYPFLQNFLKNIRMLSKQANINPYDHIRSITTTKIDKLIKIPEINESERFYFRSEIYSTRVTWDLIKEADKQIKKDYKHPIYCEILIDAINGLINHEYRKTILYSSIAIESMLAIEIDKKYEELLNKVQKNKTHRICKFETHDLTIYKDPIYQGLKEKTNFSSLLHEKPLYIMNRSLLIEDENLYRDARKLYTTRNKIVHWGEPDKNSNNHYLEINEQGAKEAYRIATEIFKWMNVNEFNTVRLDGFIEFNKN